MSRVTSPSLHRHLLHHYPFFPLDSSSSSLPPSLPPQQQQPNYPFSASSNPNPFFPSDPPPPPPPPLSIASFPANLIFPNSPHHHNKPVPTILIPIAISLAALVLIFLLLALLLLIHNRRRRNAVVSHKPLRSDNSTTHSLSPTVATTTTTSDGTVKLIPPTLRSGRGIIGTSTEFLYLGTVAANSSSEINSPELRPLPPLPKFANHSTSGEQITPWTKIEVEEE